MWRSLSDWPGGMGIIVFSLAVLPFLGVGGMQLYRAEVNLPRETAAARSSVPSSQSITPVQRTLNHEKESDPQTTRNPRLETRD